jgi:hypothetical protein
MVGNILPVPCCALSFVKAAKRVTKIIFFIFLIFKMLLFYKYILITKQKFLSSYNTE